MMFLKKAIVLILCGSLLFAGNGCKSKDVTFEGPLDRSTGMASGSDVATESGSEALGFQIVDSEIPPVWTFDADFQGDWSELCPYVNPMGAESEYSDYSMENNSSIEIQYLDSNYNLVNESIHGDVYRLSVPFAEQYTLEENLQFQKDLGQYIKALSGENFGVYDGTLTFNARDEQGDLWWATTVARDGFHEIQMVKERIFKVGETISLKASEVADPYYFSIDSDEESMVLLSATFDDVPFYGQLSIKLKGQSGDYKRSYDKSYGFESDIGQSYTITDLPRETGLIRCELEMDGDTEATVTLSLKNALTRPGHIYGENFGAIKVRAEQISGVRVQPSDDSAYIEHPDYNQEGTVLDMTPDGDYIVFLPSGYWDVMLTPVNAELIAYYSVLGVPVRSGEITGIEVPYEIAATMSMATEAIDARGVEMNHFVDLGDKVTYDFTLLDRTTSEIKPSLENTKIFEDGVEVAIESITAIDTPPEIYLLIDSSGSMKGELNGVLEAAKAFVKGLPQNSVIHLVDFDSTVKTLNGTTPEQIIGNLGKLTVGGDTALYQAIDQAIAELNGSKRPIIVAFTDGENDLKNDTTSKAEVVENLKTANIPVFCIGFGKHPDDATLKQFATVSYGRYFDAADKNALAQVFSVINERLANAYTISYKRPEQSGFGDTPIVTLMIDTSGSMEETDEGYGQRMHNVQELLKPFILELPNDFGVQLMGFEGNPFYVQSLTNDKEKLVSGVDMLMPGGGTDIPSAVWGGVLSLKNVPSTKKMMIFLTDEALDASDENFQEYAKELKAQRIYVLWVGFGNAGVEEDFAQAAALTDGEYLLTSNPKELREVMNAMLNRVSKLPDSGLKQVSMEIHKEDAQGNIESFGAAELVPLSEMKGQTPIDGISGIKESFLGPFGQYDLMTANLLSGDSLPKEDTIITSRMKVEKIKSNDAMALSIEELFFMDKLCGVEALDDTQFVAVNLKLDNVLKEQLVTVYPDGSNHPSAFVSGSDGAEEVMMVPDYMIPDFKSHFFIAVNEKGGTSASIATYLAEGSLLTPGDSSLLIQPGKSKEGVLVFVIPSEAIESLVLNFYDTSYGHLQLPIIGHVSSSNLALDALPTQLTAMDKLSDSFSLAIGGYKDDFVYDEYKEREANLMMREVTGVFVSKVQALLDIGPKDRIFMEIETENGAYYFPLHPETTQIPLGHYTAKMLAPGAQNISKWLFEIPDALQDQRANLVVELAGGDVTVPIKDGGRYRAATPLYSGAVDIDENGKADFEIQVLDAMITDSYVGNLSDGMVLLDVVIKDYEDGFSTAGMDTLFHVFNEDASREGLFSYINTPLLLGLDSDSVIYDGRTRRGLLVYEISGNESNWHVVSDLLVDMNIPLNQKTAPEFFGVFGHDYVLNDDYEVQLAEAVDRKIYDYQTNHINESEAIREGVVAAYDDQSLSLPTPAITLYGEQLISEVKTLADMRRVLKNLDYMPSEAKFEPFESFYAPEATVTQGFANENDYANLAIRLLSQLGYTPKKKVVMLTDDGLKALEKFAGYPHDVTFLPAVQYEEKGESHILVLPFVEDMKNLAGLVYYSQNQEVKDSSRAVAFTVNLLARSLKKDINTQMSDFSDALSGETEGGEHFESVQLLYENLPTDVLSTTPIDLGFYDAGSSYRLYLDVGGKLIEGSEKVLKREYEPVAVELKFNSEGKEYIKVVEIDENRSLDQFLFSIGINLPDLDEKAMKTIETAARESRASVEEVDDFTAVRWYERDMLYRFIASQTKAESDLAEQMALKIGRSDQSRMIVLTLRAPAEKKPFEASIDLLQSANVVHVGTEEATRSFNVVSGLMATMMESHVLGAKGYGAIDIIGMAPDDAELILLQPFLADESVETLQRAGVPDRVIDRFVNSDKFVLIPNKPTLINGTRRWAWLEIDPETYATIGKLDTLENGVMVSSAITGTIKDIGQYFVGGFVGVSSSIWSVSAFSLMEDDYEKILSDAKAFVLGMKDSFGLKSGPFSIGVGGKPQVSQKFGPIKASFNGQKGIGQTLFGFTEGFVAGIEYYFDASE